jgi:lysozyme family protein
MEERFISFISEVLNIEGGYSDRKNDRGGKTNFGITLQTARKYGYKGSMKDLSVQKAIEIYHVGFWLEPGIDLIQDNSVAFECLDNAINMGPGTAVGFLQRAFNVLNHNGKYGKDLCVDGRLGSITLGRINTMPEPIRLLKVINGYQAMHYIKLAEKDKTQRENIWGWINKRVEI